MNAVFCQLDIVVNWVLNIYTILLIVYAVLSWLPDLRGRWSDYLAMLVEPLLVPLRRIIPPAGGIDWSFLVLIVVIQVVRGIVAQLTLNACLY